MKKFTFATVLVLGVLGFFFSVSTTRAATSTSVPDVINAVDKSNLKYALDTLQGLLNEIQARLLSETNPIHNETEVNTTLGKIRVTLASANNAINRMIAAYESSQLSAQGVPAPVVEAVPSQVPQIAFAPGPAPANTEAPLTAEAQSGLSASKIIWPIVFIAALAVAVYFFRLEGRKEAKAIITTNDVPTVDTSNIQTPA